MAIDRRSLLISSIYLLIPNKVFSQTRSSPSIWVEVVKVIGDVGESLDVFSESLDRIIKRTTKTSDWFKNRSAQTVLQGLSGRLTALITDNKRVEIALDRYGDLWRESHRSRHKPTTAQTRALRNQWAIAVATIRLMASRTVKLLSELRAYDSTLNLESAYRDLQDALVAKEGLLDTMAHQAPPRDPKQLQQLVAQEETFLHLRANAGNALDSVNQAIKDLA